jgi:glycosyltransferase involved in cell wall biosynthesis
VRILLLTHYYPPEVGAASRRMRALVGRWCERGAEVRVVAPLPHYPEGRLAQGYRFADVVHRERGAAGERIDRVPFLPTTRGGGPKMLDQVVAGLASILPAALARGRPDVVVATIPGLPTLVPAVLSRARWRVPLVLDMRDSWPDLIEEAGLGPRRLRPPLINGITRVQRSAAAVITVSHGFADVLAERGIDPSRIHHIRNGVDTSAVPLLPPPEPGGPLRVLYLGTHGLSQGLDSVLRALAAAGQGAVQARFVGHGTEKRALQQLAAGLSAPVRFESPVTGPALWEAYTWAHTCLVPLRRWRSFRDAVPSKLYEIIACGRHVTACVEGEAEAVIAASGAGVVVPPEDPEALAAELRALSARPAALEVGPGPREWVAANASHTALADRYLAILEDVVRGRP